jgi:hypothetical protein
MRVNQTYRSLLDKSVNSMLSAIEIYNKPNFTYREETFAILAINSWELLLKAQLLRINNYNLKSIYVLEPVITKSGIHHKKNKKPKLSRSKNPMTLSLFEVIKNLEIAGFNISKNLNDSIEALVELRDNAIHFHNNSSISKLIQELGFACIKNYMNIIKMWSLEIDLSSYNFYLMPLAYVDSKILTEGIVTGEVQNYLQFVKNKMNVNDSQDEDFDIAISIDVSFTKANSFDSIGFKYEENGIPITISEEEMRKRFPFTYDEVRKKAKLRFSNFKQDRSFHDFMRVIKEDVKIYHERKLDPSSSSSMIKGFYSSNIWQELDKKYIKK